MGVFHTRYWEWETGIEVASSGQHHCPTDSRLFTMNSASAASLIAMSAPTDTVCELSRSEGIPYSSAGYTSTVVRYGPFG